jgi:hypothetical protein
MEAERREAEAERTGDLVHLRRCAASSTRVACRSATGRAGQFELPARLQADRGAVRFSPMTLAPSMIGAQPFACSPSSIARMPRSS